MSASSPRALIADDEPLLVDALARQLGTAWPELAIVARARNGRAAVEAFEAENPDICFLDVHMPGMSGIEASRLIGRRAQIVFVTAFDRYAVEAFEHGALDYLVKPVEPARLADTVERLRHRLGGHAPGADFDAMLARLAERLERRSVPNRLTWLRASIGATVRVIAVDEIDFLRSDGKYTRVAWRGDGGRPGEALIRTPIRELVAALDPDRFVQVHRSVVVNLAAVSHVVRADNETGEIHLRTRADVLPVSRTYLPLFRQM